MNQRLVIASVVIIAGVVGWHFYRQAKLLADYCFNVVGHRIVKVGLNEVIIDLYFQVYNKSDLQVTIDNYDLDVSINGQFVSKIAGTVGQTLGPRDKSVVTLRAAFPPKQALASIFNKGFLQGVVDKKQIMVGIHGTVTVSHHGIRLRNLPVQIKMPLSEMMPTPGEEVPC